MQREPLIGPDVQKNCEKTIYEVIELDVDEATHPETHSNEEILYVICGRGILTGGGEPVDIQQDMSIYLAPNLEHAVRNIGESHLRYLSMMARR